MEWITEVGQELEAVLSAHQVGPEGGRKVLLKVHLPALADGGVVEIRAVSKPKEQEEGARP